MPGQLWKRGLDSGNYASIISGVALALCGRVENKSYAAPFNAISHWVWGDDAFKHDEMDIRHTLLGYGIHHASAVFWALIYEQATKQRFEESALKLYRDAAIISLLACIVDFQITPSRFKPGFEKRLSNKALVAVYGAFALGLAWQKISRREAPIHTP
ncbi:hypothetical protein LG200_00430 [Methylobacillus caricis]|uniref:hypothetical protein n=1 Tax=Methylobacillus caricis TaxID=1971611 RepID=UPI001CFFC183|nr:hypothetical protein [Methylobacillus caricis]MCB5186468.1 hypothetical protein [Methylobacillus caricis]